MQTDTVPGRAFGEGRVPEIEALVEASWRHARAFASGRPAQLMLDVGANYGYAMHLARQDGWRAVGFDVEPQRVDGISERVLQGGTRLIDKRLTRGSVDLVFVNHVLEHLPNYTKALRRFHRVLRPHGVLFVAVPHPSSDDWEHDDGSHLTLFTGMLLAQQVERAGFTPAAPIEVKTLRPGRAEMWGVWTA